MMKTRTYRWAVWAPLSALALVSGARADNGEPVATPYRPTVANPAELSAPGWLEVEAGWGRVSTGTATRRALPYTAKLAFTEDWGFLVGGELRAWDDSSGTPLSGGGDTAFTLKHRIPGGEALNFGVEAGFKHPSAPSGLGSGERDWTLTGIASRDFPGGERLDVNLGISRLGLVEAGTGRDSLLWAASLSKAYGPWTLAAELSGTRRSGVPDDAQCLFAASYAVSKRVVVDGGFSYGRQGGVDSRGIFVGFTWLVGKVF